MNLFDTLPEKQQLPAIDPQEVTNLYKEFKPDLLYSKYSMNTARIGIELFNKAIQWKILIPYGSEYCLTEQKDINKII